MTDASSMTESIDSLSFQDQLVLFFLDNGTQLAFGPALAALLGSLYFSEIAGYVPCTLCWYQRVLMYPLSIIILVGMLKRDDLVPYYVLPMSLGGIGVSLYHYLHQMDVIGRATTCTVGVPCSARYINYYGFITIPFLALTAFTMISLLMIGVLWAKKTAEA